MQWLHSHAYEERKHFLFSFISAHRQINNDDIISKSLQADTFSTNRSFGHRDACQIAWESPAATATAPAVNHTTPTQNSFALFICAKKPWHVLFTISACRAAAVSNICNLNLKTFRTKTLTAIVFLLKTLIYLSFVLDLIFSTNLFTARTLFQLCEEL